MAASLSAGAVAVRALGHETIYLWLSKIFFGILYAEALLPRDRSNSRGNRIVPLQVLQGFQHLHLMMQAARTTIEFFSEETKFHSSILVFQLQQHPKPEHRFMYRDDIEHGCIALRLDTVGLICVSDGGAQELLADEVFLHLLDHALHPLQFEEVTAKVFVKARSFTRQPSYISSRSAGLTTVWQATMGGYDGSPVFGEFDDETYSRMLADFTGVPMEKVWPGDGTVITWIGEYDSPYTFTVTDVLWP